MTIDPVLIDFAARGVPDVMRAFDTIEARIVKLEQATTRAQEVGGRTRARLAQAEAEVRGKAAAEGAGVAAKEEKKVTEKVTDLVKYRDDVRRRSAEMAGRYAAQQANEEIREAQRAAAEVSRIRERITGGAMRGIGRAVGGFASLAGGMLAIGGGFALADIAGKQMGAERTAALLVNAVTVGGKAPAGANVAEILGKASKVATETATSKQDVVGATLAYAKSAKGGDFSGAMANMGFFAKLARTTGADINDIASGAGMLQSQNPDLKAPQMQQMLLDMYAQGKQGSRSLTEMVGLAGVIGSVRGVFGGDTTANQRKLLGLTQLAAPEAGSAEEAARGIKQMALNVEKGKNVGTLKSWGVQYNEHGQVSDVEQMVLAALKGSGGNLEKLGGVFDTRSGGLMRHMADTFNRAGGGEGGLAAAKAEMATVTQATTTSGDVEAQFQQMMNTPAEKFQAAVVRIQETIANKLEPWLGRAADKLEELVPTIEKVVENGAELAALFANNPFQGLGTILAGVVAKDVLSAGIGLAVKTSLGTAIGSALGGLAIASAALTIGVATIDLMAQREVIKEKGGVEAMLGGLNTISDLNAKRRSHTVTPEDIRKAEQEVKALAATAASQHEEAGSIRNKYFGANTWSPLTGMLGSDRSKALEGEAKSTTDTLKRLRGAIDQATASMGKMAEKLARNVPISERPSH